MSKTYGQVLLDAMEQSGPFDDLSLVEDEMFDGLARAVILEFVKRVEERAKQTQHWRGRGEDEAIAAAFEELSDELKEAK